MTNPCARILYFVGAAPAGGAGETPSYIRLFKYWIKSFPILAEQLAWEEARPVVAPPPEGSIMQSVNSKIYSFLKNWGAPEEGKSLLLLSSLSQRSEFES